MDYQFRRAFLKTKVERTIALIDEIVRSTPTPSWVSRLGESREGAIAALQEDFRQLESEIDFIDRRCR